MNNTVTKIAARATLKGVKMTQFPENLQDTHAFNSVYRTLDQVSRSTAKAFFIADPQHPGCTEGFWVPKSQCKFSFETINDDVRVTLQFNRSYTNQAKEEAKHSGISVAHVLANHITKSGGDIHCNA